jgi:hypothetical protein
LQTVSLEFSSGHQQQREQHARQSNQAPGIRWHRGHHRRMPLQAAYQPEAPEETANTPLLALAAAIEGREEEKNWD